MALSQSAPIFVAGHRGMVGSAVVRHLQAGGYTNVVTATRDELDLTDAQATTEFMSQVKPIAVVVAAAKVGGINANDTLPAEFIYNNLMIECALINSAYKVGVDRLMFLGSSCIYPKDAVQPMPESQLLAGPLEATNEPYAIAKIAGIKLCESYNRQYGTDYRSLMPTNLYGPHDNYDLETSHVIPALLAKFHAAKMSGAKSVEVWGTGRARREFLHVDDMASAVVHFLVLSKAKYAQATSPRLSHINIGTGTDISIADLALLVAKVTGYQGEARFNPDMPDGTLLKRLDVSVASELGWQAQINLEQGLADAYDWYVESLKTAKAL